MGDKKERVTGVKARRVPQVDHHEKSSQLELLNVFMGVAGRYINTSNHSGTRVLAR
jgi:hypothetical protein